MDFVFDAFCVGIFFIFHQLGFHLGSLEKSDGIDHVGSVFVFDADGYLLDVPAGSNQSLNAQHVLP